MKTESNRFKKNLEDSRFESAKSSMLYIYMTRLRNFKEWRGISKDSPASQDSRPVSPRFFNTMRSMKLFVNPKASPKTFRKIPQRSCHNADGYSNLSIRILIKYLFVNIKDFALQSSLVLKILVPGSFAFSSRRNVLSKINVERISVQVRLASQARVLLSVHSSSYMLFERCVCVCLCVCVKCCAAH